MHNLIHLKIWSHQISEEKKMEIKYIEKWHNKFK